MFGRRFRNRAGLTPLVAACVGAVSGYYIFNEPLARARASARGGKAARGVSGEDEERDGGPCVVVGGGGVVSARV